jgi:hypothetical protein
MALKPTASASLLRLSANSVLPNGTFVEFDTDEYLGEIDDANMERVDITETGEDRA